MIIAPGNYREARAFWADYIKRAHPDDDPSGIEGLSHYLPAWREAWKFCDCWGLRWAENWVLLPDFKIGDTVKSYAGVGEISYIRHSSTGQPMQAKLRLESGDRSHFINCTNLFEVSA